MPARNRLSPQFLQQQQRKTMLRLLIFTLVCAYASSVEYTLENCKCGEGYQPEANAAGKVECGGIYLAHAKPCNIPEPPKCVCTKEKVSAIQRDEEGVWCLPSGNESKKWACENKDEWDSYKVQYEEYEQTLKQ